MPSGWLAGAVGLTALLCIMPSAPAHGRAKLVRSDCPAQKDAISAAHMQCGWLETGEKLGGEPVRLRVVVLRARPDMTDTHPVVYLPGGPGDAAGLDAASLRGWRAWQQRAGWRHDVVLFDPRGTGESRPRPDCDTIRAERQSAAANAPASRAEFADEAHAALACYQVLGVRQAAALGPAAQLRDLAHLIDALDVTGVQLWGVSYGTRLARLFAARHPERVAALVLDSMFDSKRADLLAMPAQVGGAIAQLDAACRLRCTQATPAPSRSVARLLDRYAQNPPAIGTTDAYRDQFVVTPYRLLMMIVFSSYQRPNAADTIARLRRAAAGQPSALAPLVARLWRRLADNRRSEAAFWSTRCAFGDGVPDKKSWQRALSSYPAIAPYLAPARAFPVCDGWRVPHIARPSSRRTRGVPTLVLAGEADPVTPVGGSKRFMRSHPAARLLRVAGAGHAVTVDNFCAQRAVAAFLDDLAVAHLPDCGVLSARNSR